jgi:hypothetical protein
VKAKKCYYPATSPSEWVYAFYLSCNDEIAVHFRHGQKIIARTHTHPGPEIGVGGVPAVCCLYPNTAGALGRQLYDLALTWPYGGEFVHRFLYKIQPYRIVPPPEMPCAGCATTVGLVSSANPSCAGDAVTFTATVANSDGTSVPGGQVAFYVDGSLWPPSQHLVNGQAAFTTPLLSAGRHQVRAVFLPDSGFQPSQASLVQVVLDCGSGGGGGGNLGCCPGVTMPATLFGTFANGTGNAACLNGISVQLTEGQSGNVTAWIGSTGAAQATCGSGATILGMVLTCSNGTWTVSMGCEGQNFPVGSNPTGTCNPVHLTFAGLPVDSTGCCTGSVDIVITP